MCSIQSWICDCSHSRKHLRRHNTFRCIGAGKTHPASPTASASASASTPAPAVIVVITTAAISSVVVAAPVAVTPVAPVSVSVDDDDVWLVPVQTVPDVAVVTQEVCKAVAVVTVAATAIAIAIAIATISIPPAKDNDRRLPLSSTLLDLDLLVKI